MRDARLIGLRRDHIDVAGQLARDRFENSEARRMNASSFVSRIRMAVPFPALYARGERGSRADNRFA